MAFHEISFVELHGPFFMQGSNLGSKINAKQKGALIFWDDVRNVHWIYFKQKCSVIPKEAMQSWDMVTIPSEIQTLLGITPKIESPVAEEVPPIIAKRRGRPPLATQEAEMPAVYDPNDEEAAALHRAAVRAASANANKVQPTMTNDLLVEQSRAAAMGVKLNRSAQVHNAQQVGETASVAGKPKALSHAQLKAQIKAEEKTTL